MSLATLVHGRGSGSSAGLWESLRRVPSAVWIVLAILLSWGAEYVVYRAFEPPGVALGYELQGAAGELDHALVPLPSAALRQDIRRHFREADVAVDTARYWPNVAVTLSGVSRTDCAAAVSQDRRMDGTVVILLQGYPSAENCGHRNDMTWWLMP
ncbi:MAG TPA: hypothetical protein VMA53_09085 [Stellaceae bacterium]|nr:hypothetical protein [Stellaceae bacterium]